MSALPQAARAARRRHAARVRRSRSRWRGCGVLVTEAALRSAIVEGTDVAAETFELELEPPERFQAPIKCPRCEELMAQHQLYTMQVDRCPAHGVWFDGPELAQVLLVAKPRPPEVGDRVRTAVAGGYTAIVIALSIVRFIWF